eukprot:c12097_g1_i1.p1 GENE.c12097_g1_i1~~c12097_g1_i1.p1  ORF type:complete len:126 (+),score=22.84 c12097_g1_i1:134-511(+)
MSGTTPEASYEIGMKLLKQGDTKAAFTELNRACDLRHPEACYELGRRKLESNKILSGKHCLERACRYGSGPACFTLAQHLVLHPSPSAGEEESLKFAFALFKRGCEEGHEQSCKALGMLGRPAED